MKSSTKKIFHKVAETAIVVAGAIVMTAIGAVLAIAAFCQPWEVGL